MKTTLLVALLSLAFGCQAQAVNPAFNGCGPDATQFKVKTNKKAALPAASDSGSAQVVFLETLSGEFGSAPTVRFAVDGKWVGADRGASYFAVSVPPGPHTICTERQSSIHDEKDEGGMSTLHAEAGKTYFYEARVVRTEVGAAARQGGSSLPGQYPGSMTAKENPTMDSVVFKDLSAEEGPAHLNHLSLSTSTVK